MKLFKAFSKQPPRSAEFTDRIGHIERQVKQDLREAQRLLDVLMGELRTADDGVGGYILSGEHYNEFIACNGRNFSELV